MPRAKTSKSSPRKRQNKKTEEDALMDFEQFISQKPPSPNRARAWWAMTLIVLIVVLAAIWFFMSQATTVQKELKFKAVYLEGGQTYYAKVVKEDALNVYLDDVYYIEERQQIIPPESEEEDVEPQTRTVLVLVKRGSEPHDPTGWLQVNRQKVLAIEEMGPDSEIIKEINRKNSQ